MTAHQLVFIGGLHRSGTSPLFKALRERPEVAAFRDTGVPEDEGQHLQDVYPPARAHGGPGLFGFNPASHLTEDSPLATGANATESARRLMDCWSKHWDMSRPLLLEKSPPNLLMTRFLRRLFPDCRFIIVVRHPVAVALATQKWSGTTLESLIEHWIVCYEIFREDVARLKLNPGDLRIIAYERLIQSPATELAQIHEWLGLEPTPPPFDFTSKANTDYFERFEELKRADPNLLPAMMENHEARAQALGYSLADLSEAGPERALGY